MEEKYKYEIGGKVYFQRPLVLGQINQLMNVLGSMPIPLGMQGLELFIPLGPMLPKALAVVLCEEGKPLKDKNLDDLAKEIEFAIDPETVVTVVNDFFLCNPISSMSEKLDTWAKVITVKLGEIGSKKPASSSAEETSQSGSGSSGTSISPSQEPGQS